MRTLLTKLQAIQRSTQIAIVAYALVITCCLLLYQWLTPSFSGATYITDSEYVGADWNRESYELGSGAVVSQSSDDAPWGVDRWKAVTRGTERLFKMPLVAASAGKAIQVQIDMHVGRLYPTTYHLYIDDCIRSLSVNGQNVDGANYCGLESHSIDLGSYLHVGTNHIEAQLEDSGGWAVFRFFASPQDVLFVLLRYVIFIATLCFGWFLLRTYQAQRATWILFFLVCMGAFWLKFYDTHFLYYQQNRDWDGHLDYVVYVREYWNIPPAGEDHPMGWEYYQPPGYYFLLAAWGAIGSTLGRSEQLILQDYEVISWLFVVIALAVVALIARVLFAEKKNEWLQYMFVACMMAFPVLVYFSGIISNDVLFHLMGVFITLTLLLWWRTHRQFYWYLTALLIGLGMLVKSNIIPFIAVIGACLFFVKDWTRQMKVRMGGEALGIILLVAGWYLALRFFIEGETFIVGNTLTHYLGVENGWRNYLTFNPLKIILIPFNENWGDAFRRQYFWEYVFRSAFFSEFRFGERFLSLASFLLFVGLVLLPVTIWGVITDLRDRARETVPLLTMLFVFFAALTAYRYISPFSANQDFRFISPVVVPLFYYMLRGVQALPAWMQRVGQCFVALLIVTSSFFIWLLTIRY